MSNLGKILSLVLVLLFLASFVIFCPDNVKAQIKTITVPDQYPTIQAAIEHSNAGDTIIVKSGTYNEQTWKITKSLTITSEFPHQAKLNFHPSTYNQTLQLGRLASSQITTTNFNRSIEIEANNFTLSGFVITNDAKNAPPLLLYGYVTATGNQIQIINNIIGTQQMPFNLEMSGNSSQAVNNTVVGGLSVAGSNQTAAYNIIGSLDVSGSFNLITKNNGQRFWIIGSHNAVTGNSFVDNTPGGIGVWLMDADYNIITNNTIIGSSIGIAIGYRNPGGSYNLFAGNTVQGGTTISNASYNVFYGNLISHNKNYNLAIGGNNNLFFENSFLNNSKNFGTKGQEIGSNSFDAGTIGNYWDDSGIGYTPYLIYGNVKDNFPMLFKPNVSDAVPVLPSPWSSLLSSVTASMPSKSLTSAKTELTIWVILLLVAITVAIAGLLVYFKKHKRQKQP